MTVTACLIVKNESENIVKCISSFKDLTDEIIVVDTGSEDDTVLLAESLGAKVLKYKWNNDFASARNYALGHANGDWILFLDADEYILPIHVQKLQQLFKMHLNNRQYDGISTRMTHIDKASGNMLGSNMTIRFFRNTSRIRYVGSIHEELVNGDKPLSVLVDNDICIYHTGYSMDIVHAKSLRNLNQLQSLADEGKADVMTYYYLSSCCFSLGKYDEAIKHAKYVLKSDNEFKGLEIRNIGCSLFTIYIESMLALGNKYTNDEIYPVIGEALNKYGYHPEIKRYEADYYCSIMHYDEALTCYKQAMELNNNYTGLERNDFMGRYHEVTMNMGQLYSLKNDPMSALDCFVNSLKTTKYNDPAFRGLMDIIGDERAEDIILFINSIYDLSSREDIRFLVRNLGQLRLALPFLYYFKIWNSTFNQWDISAVIALLVSGNAQEALDIAYSFYKQSGDKQFEFMAVVSLVSGCAKDWYESHKSDIDHTYHRILDAYFNNENIHYSVEESNIHLKVLMELILLDDKNAIDRIITTSEQFGAEKWTMVANFCRDSRFYRKAIEYYQEACAANPGNSENHAGMGFCSFKLKEYENSVAYTEKALLKGYRGQDVLDMLKWVYESNIESDIKNRADQLYIKYSAAKEI